MTGLLRALFIGRTSELIAAHPGLDAEEIEADPDQDDGEHRAGDGRTHVGIAELELDTAQRILDFLSGAVYALNGTMCKISRGIFVVAPNNYDVVGNGEDDYGDLV